MLLDRLKFKKGKNNFKFKKKKKVYKILILWLFFNVHFLVYGLEMFCIKTE